MQDNHCCVTHSVREEYVFILHGCGSNRQSSSWFNLDTSSIGSQERIMGLGLGGFLIYNTLRFFNPVYKIIKGIVHPKVEILSLFIHPHVPNLYELFFCKTRKMIF